jgi:hypothetical protein
MFYQKIAGLIGKSWSRKRNGRAPVTKRFTRRLGFLCLEDRRMLASILGTAESFAVLGASTVTNTGPTTITGDTGVYPGPSITGFAIPPANTVVEGPGSTGLVAGPGLVTGTIYISHAVADQAQVDTTTAYLGLAAMPFTSNLTGQDLGGQTLTPGVYHFDSSAQLTGTLTLDAEGNDNAFWVFQIGSTLTTASASTVQVINFGSNGGSDVGLFWQVGSSATLGTSTSFEGNILALASISLNTSATILNGRALAQTGAVTLDTNTISNVCPIDGPGNGGPGYSGGLRFDDHGNVVPVASIAWEKRATDANPVLLGGATFEISPNPLTGVGTLIVVDGGVNDADGLANGVLQVNNVLLGIYTIIETVAPPGFVIDDDPTRSVTVSAGDLNAVIGTPGSDDPGDTNESDFHNRLGSIAWEKRATDANPVLLAGATFEIAPNPLTGMGTLIVVDGGANDADGLANGVLQVNEVLLGTYTITETIAPPGFLLDDVASRSITVSILDPIAVIGVQGSDNPGDTDESDFHNRLERSIAWEKRATDSNPVLLAGATFEISPDPLTGVGTLIVVDGGLNDADGIANGVLLVANVLLGTYTITETIAPAGFLLDDVASRSITVSILDPNAVIGVQGSDDPGDTDESDFHNRLESSLAWEKRATDANPVLLAGATFEISPDPLTGVGTLIVVDGGLNDADGIANGVLLVANVPEGTYTITEIVAPPGYALDDVVSRSITVSGQEPNAVIGVQGSDDPGDTDESDFHNRLGSIAWEKRATDANPVLLGGATFEISPNPLTGVGTLIVVDGGVNDADGLANGVLQVNHVFVGTYTITEIVAPGGFALDDVASRSITVSSGNLNAVVGTQGSDDPGDTDDSDFHNRLGSIAWEKRATDANPMLLGGATFVISPHPLTGVGTLIVVDGGVNDADGLANGVLQVNNVLLGIYTIIETVAPPGFVIDDDPTRSVTVSAGDLNAVIGTPGSDDPGDTNESDFHNRLGSLAWEKRATDANPVLLAGATFEIDPNPLTGVGTLIVVDGGANDADGLANGVLQVNHVFVGTYTITEILAPGGFALDDVASRSITVSSVNLNAVVGTQGSDDPGNTDESDFHNRLGSIAWEKRATDANPLLLAGATFEIDPHPLTGVGTLIVVDGGVNDADGLPNGVLQINDVLLGTYTITETIAPPGYALDDVVSRSITVSTVDLNAVIGTQGSDQPGNTNESDFHNRLRSVIVIGNGKSPRTPQFVTVIDQVTGDVLAQFAPYGNTFQGGVRVATGDLTGDGVDEIVTAPGWSIVAEVRVYTQEGVLLTSFLPYGPTFNGGVQVAVADVDGDGLNDIITVPSWGPAEVKVFKNELDGDGLPTFDASNPYRDFLAFPSSFIGGAVVAAADMGSTPLPNGPFDNTLLDQQAEIVVGSNAGMQTTVKVFDVSGLTTLTPNAMSTAAGSFTPFSTTTKTYKGGVSLSVARINADPVPDIVVGAGANGGSLVDVWAWSNTSSATLSSLSENGIGFAAFEGASRTAPVQVAALDTNGDDIADAILAVQGPGGTTGQIQVFNITSAAPWLEVSLPTEVPGGFADAYLGPYFIAAISDLPSVLPLAAPHGVPYYADPHDINGDGRVTPLDALILINYINFDGDGGVAPLDVLVVINFINNQEQVSAGEAESVTTATTAIEIPVVPAGFALPAMESYWMDAEVSASAPSVGRLDNGLPGVWSTPDAWTGSLPERGLVTRARDRAQPVDLDTDLFKFESLLDDIVLDIARSWNPSA